MIKSLIYSFFSISSLYSVLFLIGSVLVNDCHLNVSPVTILIGVRYRTSRLTGYRSGPGDTPMRTVSGSGSTF